MSCEIVFSHRHIIFNRSEAKDLLGDDWVQRQRRIVQQHANTYQRAAWGKVISISFLFFQIYNQMPVCILMKFPFSIAFTSSTPSLLCIMSFVMSLEPLKAVCNFSEDLTFELPLGNVILQALSYLSGSASSSGQLSGGSSDGSGISKSAIKER